MAGYTNPLDDLYTRRDGLDPNIYTPPQRPRRSSFETFLDSLDEQDRMAEEAAARQQELAAGSNLGAPKETGFGGLRKAEAEMAAQQALQEEIQADPEGWVAKQRKQLEANRALLDAYTQETLGLDPTRDAATINQRTEQIRIARNEMDAQAKALGEFEAEVQAAMQATPEDQGFLASALGGINDALEWKPVKSVIEFLSGPQEMLTGLASYPAEWLAAATGANTKFTPASAEDWAEHGLTGGIGSAVNPDNALRQRGREFTELVARTLNVSGLGTTGTGQKFVADMSPVATWAESYFDGDEFGAGGKLDDMTMTMGYALVTDPAMLIDAGVPVGKVLGTGSRFVGKNAMKLKPVADFVAKHPEFINKPQRFWLRMTGEAKKADVLGNEKLTEIYLHEQAFNQTASTEALRFQAQLKHDTRRILNDLTEAQRAEVFEKLPTLVENPTYREFSKAGLLDEPLSADKQVEQALYDYAEIISASNADILAMEQRWGLKTVELAEDFEYFGRQLSDEALHVLATKPDARKAWLGTKAKQSREALRSALEAPEQARKLRGQDFETAERTMREMLEPFGLRPEDPVWTRDASDVLLKRVDRSLEAAKVRNLTARAAEVYGFTPDGAEDLARSVVRVLSDQSPDVVKLSIDKQADVVLAELAKQGLAPNPGQMTALELMKKANVNLPDSLEELAYLGTKYLDEADGKEFAKYAKNHYWQHLDKPGKFWGYYDALKGIYQRSTLARVASLTKDLLGTSTQSFMAGNVEELPAALKALGGFNDWRQGMGASDEVLQLKAAGVLRTTKGEARTGKGAFEGVPLVGNIEQSGVIGGTLRAARAEKLGTKVGETIGALNDARVYWEEANRVATFMKARKAGMSFDEAVQEVYKYWGKFDELSRFERTVLNRIMFFWSWMARSVPTALRSTLEHPVRARLLLTLMAGNVTGNDDMPEWMQRMGGVILGQNEDGSFNVINTGNSTYFSPTMSALQSDMIRAATSGRFDEAVVEAGREVTRSAPPFVTGIYERLNQKETFTNRDWYADPNNKIGSQVKAPAMFYWMEGTAVGNWLGIESVTEETPEGVRVKSVVMDPEVANTLSFIPGLEPAMNDVGSFLDPRGQPNADISPGKGLMRTAGVPLYNVIGENETQRKALQFRKALNKSIDQMPGNALTSNGKDIYPNKNSKRGRELADAKARLEQKAKDSGLGPRARKAWVLEQLRAVYPAEAEIMELDERLNLLEDVAEAQKEGATLSPLEGAEPLGSLAPRFERQDIREARARMR